MPRTVQTRKAPVGPGAKRRLHPDEPPPLTRSQIRELKRRVSDLEERTRYLLVSMFTTKHVLYKGSFHLGRIDLCLNGVSSTPEAHRPAGVIMQDYHVLEARYVSGYVVWLRFRDGTAGEIDLGPALRGPVFEPLRDPHVFRSFAIHPEFRTLAWPNGADFAPEFLHDNLRVMA